MAAAGDAGSASIPGDHMREGSGVPETSKTMLLHGPFTLENGAVLPSVTLAYNTYGALNARGDNVALVGHSLTSNSCVHEWWSDLLGSGPSFTLDTSRFFVLCVNYLASVYGSSSPVSVDPATHAPYSADFPITSIRDNVRLQRRLCDALGVTQLALCIGGSLGGMLALEWAITYPAYVTDVVLIASCARHTDWAIGIGEVERQAIYADSKWRGGYYSPTDAPMAGLAVARMAAMLSYRSPQSFDEKFKRAVRRVPRTREEMVRQGSATAAQPSGQGGAAAGPVKAGEGHVGAPYFEVEGYLNYQGDKFIKRFDPCAYVRLTQTLDTHDVGVGHSSGDYRVALRSMPHRVFIAGIDSDILYPLSLQSEMADLIPRSHLHVISSPHGHDSFLIEIKSLNAAIVAWLRERTPAASLRPRASSDSRSSGSSGSHARL